MLFTSVFNAITARRRCQHTDAWLEKVHLPVNGCSSLSCYNVDDVFAAVMRHLKLVARPVAKNALFQIPAAHIPINGDSPAYAEIWFSLHRQLLGGNHISSSFVHQCVVPFHTSSQAKV